MKAVPVAAELTTMLPSDNPLAHRPTLWSEGTPVFPASAPLPRACDVAIIGAGITGMTAALHLRGTGRSVVVIDQNEHHSGTTRASSAHLTTWLDSGLRRTEKIFSASANRAVARAMSDAIAQIAHWVGQYDLDCDFQRVEGTYFAENEEGAATLREEAEAARRAGLDPQPISAPPLPFPVRAAFCLDDQAQFDPAAYIAGLARAFVAAGGIFVHGTRVTDFRDGHPCGVTTDSGSLRADELILATHTPLGRSLLHAELEPRRSYLIAAELADEPPPGLFWDTHSPYHYLRRVDQPGHTPRLLLGGADHKTGSTPTDPTPDAALETWLRDRFAVTRIVARWSAQYYEPVDGFPFVGRPLTGTHTLVATGYNGDGLTLGTAAGGLLADIVQEREMELLPLFSPTRVKAKAAGHFVSFNLSAVRHLTAPSSDEQPSPGEGRVRRVGASLRAVYRTRNGEEIVHSARCPHLGCIVEWNAVEKTWDCPCHGGRFAPDGMRIEGPPRADLHRPNMDAPAKG